MRKKVNYAVVLCMFLLLISGIGVCAEGKQYQMYVGKSGTIPVKGSKSWYSENTDIIKVNSVTGKMKPLREGTTRVCVTTQKKIEYLTITVREPYLSKTEVTLKKGKSVSLKLTGTSAQKWKSSDPTIASVSGGKVTGKKEGTVSITCTGKDRKSYVCLVHVTKSKSSISESGEASSAATAVKVAHRGYSTAAPENTMASFRLAAERGYQYIECDIRFTKDGIPVILHDATVDATSNGKGRADSFTYAQIRKLDFGSWKSKQYAGEKIPSLQQVLTFCKKHNIKLYLELKNKSGLTKAKVRSLYKQVKKAGMAKNVIWFSFQYDYIKWMKETAPSAEIGLIIKDLVTEKHVDKMAKLKTGKNQVFLCVFADKVSPSILKKCKTKQVGLSARAVHSRTALNKLDPYYKSAIGNGF